MDKQESIKMHVINGLKNKIMYRCDSPNIEDWIYINSQVSSISIDNNGKEYHSDCTLFKAVYNENTCSIFHIPHPIVNPEGEVIMTNITYD